MTHPEADYEIDIDPAEFRKADEELAKLRAKVPDAQREPGTDRELAVIQAAAAEPAIEGSVKTGDTVEFLGKKFRVADKIGLMPLLKYSAAAEMRSDDPRALAAIYAMLRDCIYPGTPGCGECEDCRNDREAMCKAYDQGDWGAFEDHAMMTRADAEDLLDVITDVMEVISGRPTPPPAGSSPGRRSTRAGSTGNSSARRGRGSRR